MPRIRRSSRAASSPGCNLRETLHERRYRDFTRVRAGGGATVSLVGCPGETTPWRRSATARILRLGKNATMPRPVLFMSASAAIADLQLRPARRRAGSALGRSTSCSRSSSFPRLRAPRHGRLTASPASASVARLIRRAADLASRLRTFATNRHEQCGPARLALLCADGGWPTHCLKTRGLWRRPEAAGRRSAARGAGNSVRAAERS